MANDGLANVDLRLQEPRPTRRNHPRDGRQDGKIDPWVHDSRQYWAEPGSRYVSFSERTTRKQLTSFADRPLGLDIPLYEGPTRYNFTLPSDLPSRSTYILSFQGSSGNISPEFTIIGSTTSESASPTTTTTAWVDTIPWETPTQTGSGTMATETEVSVQTTLPVSGADRSTSTLAPTATGVAAPATTLSTSGAGRRGGWTGAVGAILLVGAMVV